MKNIIDYILSAYNKGYSIKKASKNAFIIDERLIYVFSDINQTRTIKNELIKLKVKYPNKSIVVYSTDRDFNKEIIKKVNINFELLFGRLVV